MSTDGFVLTKAVLFFHLKSRKLKTLWTHDLPSSESALTAPLKTLVTSTDIPNLKLALTNVTTSGILKVLMYPNYKP